MTKKNEDGSERGFSPSSRNLYRKIYTLIGNHRYAVVHYIDLTIAYQNNENRIAIDEEIEEKLKDIGANQRNPLR